MSLRGDLDLNLETMLEVLRLQEMNLELWSGQKPLSGMLYFQTCLEVRLTRDGLVMVNLDDKLD